MSFILSPIYNTSARALSAAHDTGQSVYKTATSPMMVNSVKALSYVALGYAVQQSAQLAAKGITYAFVSALAFKTVALNLAIESATVATGAAVYLAIGYVAYKVAQYAYNHFKANNEGGKNFDPTFYVDHKISEYNPHASAPPL
jgi:hypothetical protein